MDFLLPNGLTARIENLADPKMRDLASTGLSRIQKNRDMFIVVTVELAGNKVHLIYEGFIQGKRNCSKLLKNELRNGHWNVLNESFRTVYHNTTYPSWDKNARVIHRAIMYKISPDVWVLVH